jgi:DNA-binding MarR family transcriptional regulator
MLEVFRGKLTEVMRSERKYARHHDGEPADGFIVRPGRRGRPRRRSRPGRAALQLPGPLDAQLQHDSGITMFEYMVLSSLSMCPDHARRMSELARLSNGSLSRLSNVAKRLERRGWLRREPDPEDGRSIVARLTESGWKVVQAAAPGHVEAVRRLVIDPLTGPQLETLAAAAQSIVGSLEQAGSACTEHIDPCAAEDPC